MSQSELLLPWDSSRVNYTGYKKIHLSGSKDKILLFKDSTIPSPMSLRVSVTLQSTIVFKRFLPLFLINTVIAI